MWQVIGQLKAIRLFEHSLRTGTVAHAYLLVGPPHVGKGALAINIAQALNCTGAEPPCGQCPSCLRIAQAKHADVRVIHPADLDAEEKARQKIGTDTIKELQYFASLPPYEGKYRVFIIDGAENMSAEAGNRILKVLEEPSPTVVWLLLAAEETKLLPTVASRCQRVELKPASVSEVASFLQERHGVDAPRAGLLARLSGGCPGWAVSAASDSKLMESRARALETLISLLGADLYHRLQNAAELSRSMERDRRAGADLLKTWLGFWRDVLLVKNGCADGVVNIDYQETLNSLASSATLKEIKAALDQLNEAIYQIARNANAQLALEVLFLNMPTYSMLLSSVREEA
ncbi:MAG: DNA polymerase III subunit [Chloroflexota bacterium]